MKQLCAPFSVLFAVLVSFAGVGTAHAAMINSDIVIFMDESGSTGNAGQPKNGYSNLLQSNVFSYLNAFDSVLNDRGIAANFALVGFGGANSIVNVITDEFTSSANVAEEAKKLIANGDSRGVYTALNVALNNLSYAADAIKNFIVFTDEEATDPFFDRGDAEQFLTANNVALNSVVNGGGTSDLAALALTTGGNYFDVNAFKSANDAQAEQLMSDLANVKASEISGVFCDANPAAPQCQTGSSQVNAPAGLGLFFAGIAMVMIRKRNAHTTIAA